jgi:hypothetical protein
MRSSTNCPGRLKGASGAGCRRISCEPDTNLSGLPTIGKKLVVQRNQLLGVPFHKKQKLTRMLFELEPKASAEGNIITGLGLGDVKRSAR